MLGRHEGGAARRIARITALAAAIFRLFSGPGGEAPRLNPA
jgi:hypothetical protein